MALSEEQLEILADEYLTELYQELEREVIQDIARRVRGTERFTETAEIMAKSMAEHGFNPAEIYDAVMKSLGANEAYQEYIAENTRQYKREVMEKIRETEEAARKAGNDLIAEAGNMAFNDDLQMWQQAGQDLPRPDSMEQLVNAFQRQTAGEIRNLTRTTGFRNTQLGTVAVQQAFQRSLDLATLKMCTGAFSYDQACNDAIKQLAQSGLRQIKYESGRTYQLDTAVRMCVRTAASQLAGRVTEENCRKTGQDLVITSQHVGARPAHIEFENKVFSLSGKNKKYPAFSDPIEAGGAGYGEIGGIKGVNCRHNFYPFWEGISKIPPTLERPEPKEYNGKTYDYYQATQQQRAMEREIRALKRERYATDDPDERREINRQIKQKTAEYRSFSNAMGIRAKENRLLMPGERSPYVRQTPSSANTTGPGETLKVLRRETSFSNNWLSNLLRGYSPNAAEQTILDNRLVHAFTGSDSTSDFLDDKRFEEWKKEHFVSVVDEYIAKATPRTGTLSYEEGIEIDSSTEENNMARKLFNLFGGDIRVLNEAHHRATGQSPDYVWNEFLWELKTPIGSLSSADKLLQTGIHQINTGVYGLEAGGVIMDVTELKKTDDTLTDEQILNMCTSRLRRTARSTTDVIVIENNTVLAIVRYKY